MGKLCIEELDIAFIHASTYQIDPPKEDSTYGMSGDRLSIFFRNSVWKNSATMQLDALPHFIFFWITNKLLRMVQ